jgi:hypothetical protein
MNEYTPTTDEVLEAAANLVADRSTMIDADEAKKRIMVERSSAGERKK